MPSAIRARQLRLRLPKPRLTIALWPILLWLGLATAPALQAQDQDFTAPDWDTLATSAALQRAGIQLLSGHSEEPPIRSWAVVIPPGVSVSVRATDDPSGKISTGAFAQTYDACVAFNAGYFRMYDAPSTHVSLLRIADSTLVPVEPWVTRGRAQFPAYRAAFGILEDGSYDLSWPVMEGGRLMHLDMPLQNRPGRPAEDRGRVRPWLVRDAVAAGPMLVQDSLVFIPVDEEVFFGTSIPNVHPRTAIGYRSDGTLVALIVDGRQAQSRGVSLEELAAMMLDLGTVEALNLDGGGSSTLVVDGELVNRPNGDTYQRAVVSAISVDCASR